MRYHPPQRQSTWTAANRVVANSLQIAQEGTRQACCLLADESAIVLLLLTPPTLSSNHHRLCHAVRRVERS
jgi:hypothetical protein